MDTGIGAIHSLEVAHELLHRLIGLTSSIPLEERRATERD
jgi:hypothetical protein